jgi:hypothetical protein
MMPAQGPADRTAHRHIDTGSTDQAPVAYAEVVLVNFPASRKMPLVPGGTPVTGTPAPPGWLPSTRHTLATLLRWRRDDPRKVRRISRRLRIAGWGFIGLAVTAAAVFDSPWPIVVMTLVALACRTEAARGFGWASGFEDCARWFAGQPDRQG